MIWQGLVRRTSVLYCRVDYWMGDQVCSREQLRRMSSRQERMREAPHLLYNTDTQRQILGGARETGQGIKTRKTGIYIAMALTNHNIS